MYREASIGIAMWLPICRRNWRGERSRICSQEGSSVGAANDVVSGAASGDGDTGMLEGTANGDRKLEGTEHELSTFDILLDSVSFYRIWMKNGRCN